MVFVFRSNLGKNVSHDCYNGGHIYITKTPARLRFFVAGKTVFLSGGCSTWCGEKKKWTEGEFHAFPNPIPMGRVI